MIELGKYQTLEIRRIVDFGAYLSVPGEDTEVLIPGRYLPENMQVGDSLEVFVYKDSEDRPIATTERPYATVGEFAFLSVNAVNDTGAFLDWGLPKDLLVPYGEQRMRMRRGGIYLVYIYVDKATGRIVATTKTDKYLGNVFPDYKLGDRVQALVVEHTDIGYKVIVDNLHTGMIYSNELYRAIEIEEMVTAYVKQVRDEGKIDLTVNEKAVVRQSDVAERIMNHLSKENAAPISEKMSPDIIDMAFHCSKKDFKKAIGHLYKERMVVIAPDGTVSLPPKQ